MQRRTELTLAVLVLGIVLMLGGCPTQQAADEGPAPEPPPAEPQTPPEEGHEMGWRITSNAFAEGERIPEKYTADGENVSPPIDFGEAPEGTVEVALICHDPDAPREGGWTHWVLWGLSPDVEALPEAVPTTAQVEDPPCMQGENSGGKIGYMGPSPPPGDPHRYQFTAYALSESVSPGDAADRDALLAAMEGNIIAQTMLEGLYSR